MLQQVVIASAKRTPIGKFLGVFSDIPAADLGAVAVKGALQDAKVDPNSIDEVIFGHARQAGNGPNTARQVMFKSGIPITVTAFTVNKACGSSLKAIALAAQAIKLGEADIIVAGGIENMSRTPFLLDRGRKGYRLGNTEVQDAMYKDGFLCPLCGLVMGETAENLVRKYSISRSEQDKYALVSQERYGKWKTKSEICPVGDKADDEHPRPNTTLNSLVQLKPVFRADGTITAGNSSGITDGAAAVVVMSEKKSKELGIKPMAKITGWAQAGVDPAYMGIGPVPAIQKLEKILSVKLDSFDLIELNEAFAAQVLACQKELKLDLNRTNVNGGAIALGHPIGATGARIVVTLLNEMVKRNCKTGLATLCMSGGLGMAVSFERI